MLVAALLAAPVGFSFDRGLSLNQAIAGQGHDKGGHDKGGGNGNGNGNGNGGNGQRQWR